METPTTSTTPKNNSCSCQRRRVLQSQPYNIIRQNFQFLSVAMMTVLLLSRSTTSGCMAWISSLPAHMSSSTSHRHRLSSKAIFYNEKLLANRRKYYPTITGRLFSSSQVIQENNSSIKNNSNDTDATATSTAELLAQREQRKRQKAEARKRRRQLIGKAKAMDHGQPGVVTYQIPRNNSTGQYVAASGLPDRTKPFTVLGIESSCDDTGAAIVRSDGVILGEALASQNDIHEEWGGVVPGLARDAHVEQIDGVVETALRRAGLDSVDQVDAIGVTVGPGLEICLRVGATKARELAIQYQKPFVGVHHLEAHILMARLPLEEHNNNLQHESIVLPATLETHASTRTMDFPFLALLVSGGHCQILKCLDVGKYSILGGTYDDSLGEAFDKTARLLGLPVGGGGGPALEKLAKEGDSKAIALPVPLQKRKDCDFSFAGLKTAVRRAAEKLCGAEQNGSVEDLLSHEDKANIAASFQNTAIKHIEQRLERAMKLVDKQQQEAGGVKIRSLAVVGGVAANQELRSRLEAMCERLSEGEGGEDWKMFVPPPRLCTDQGSMSAWAAIERLMVGSSDDPNNQEVYARYPFSLEHENNSS